MSSEMMTAELMNGSNKACHPEPRRWRRTSRPVNRCRETFGAHCELRMISLTISQLQMRGPSASARVGMTD
jgi:hypothetical protein